MRLKEPFIKYKGPRARMVCAPQREALPALYSPKPWGHREWVYSSASLKMLSLTMASKEEKSAFYYCLILVSLVCKFSVVSLNWTRRSLWIDLLLWKTELEASLKFGSLGPSQPPQLTSGKTTLCFPYWRQTWAPTTSRGTWWRFSPGFTGSPDMFKVHILSSNPEASEKTVTCGRAKTRCWEDWHLLLRDGSPVPPLIYADWWRSYKGIFFGF